MTSPSDPGLQVPEGARGDGPAVVDDHDLVGQGVGLVEVVGGEQDVGPPGHQSPHGVPHLAAAGGVETGGGFVEEQEPGRPDQAGAQIETPALATRIGGASGGRPPRPGRAAR